MNVTLQQVSLCFKAARFKGQCPVCNQILHHSRFQENQFPKTFILSSADDLEVSAAVPQYMVLVLQGVLLTIALYWPLSVAYRLVSPFLWAAIKTVKGILSVLAFTLGFKRFPFSVSKLKFKLKKKKKKTEEEEKRGKSQDGECEKKDSKEKSSAFSKFFKRDKNKPKEAAE